jgi:hypothetical protein
MRFGNGRKSHDDDQRIQAAFCTRSASGRQFAYEKLAEQGARTIKAKVQRGRSVSDAAKDFAAFKPRTNFSWRWRS